MKDWNEAAQQAEEEAKKVSEFLMFCIGNPRQEGVNISAYSLVEATMGLYDKPDRTVLVFDLTDLTAPVLKAMTQCQKVLKSRFPEANIFGTLNEAVDFFAKVNR